MKKFKSVVLAVLLIIAMFLLSACAIESNDTIANISLSFESSTETTELSIETVTTIKESIVENSILYLSKPDVDVFNTDFIYCEETDKKAKMFSDSLTFLADLGVESDDNYKPNIVGSFNADDMAVAVSTKGTFFNISEINVKNNKNYKFGFNGNIFIGTSLDDVKNIYGEPNESYDRQNTIDAFIEYSFEHNKLRVYHRNNIVTSFRIFLQHTIPFLHYENYLSIYKLETANPNSVGGVDVDIMFSNDNKKAIKYIYFHVTPYNAVNDIVYSQIGNKSTAGLQVTGAIEYGHKSSSWENVWYNSTIKYAILESVRIIYMDEEEVILYVE